MLIFSFISSHRHCFISINIFLYLYVIYIPPLSFNIFFLLSHSFKYFRSVSTLSLFIFLLSLSIIPFLLSIFRNLSFPSPFSISIFHFLFPPLSLSFNLSFPFSLVNISFPFLLFLSLLSFSPSLALPNFPFLFFFIFFSHFLKKKSFLSSLSVFTLSFLLPHLSLFTFLLPHLSLFSRFPSPPSVSISFPRLLYSSQTISFKHSLSFKIFLFFLFISLNLSSHPSLSIIYSHFTLSPALSLSLSLSCIPPLYSIKLYAFSKSITKYTCCKNIRF
ncbi:unnamed protein product [Acanthosepion pharaonis]|uniref:Uncharacterized protein n=1 Tax=Acanthosepion pharaonis TaxID=158019 RepID=A0A812CZY2_ACAPH|nr:unnamed protein product [Sepia pharaonis]